MTFFYFYLLFAITTGFFAIIELFLPVMYELRIEYPDNPVSKSFGLTLVVLTFLAVLFAPVIFPVCMISRLGNNFREGLKSGFLED